MRGFAGVIVAQIIDDDINDQLINRPKLIHGLGPSVGCPSLPRSEITSSTYRTRFGGLAVALILLRQVHWNHLDQLTPLSCQRDRAHPLYLGSLRARDPAIQSG